MRLFGYCLLLTGMLWGQAHPEWGTLEITAAPGLQVFWEGREIGMVPESGLLSVRDIPPGQYRFELKRDGLSNLSQTIAIAPGMQRLTFRPSTAGLAAPAIQRSTDTGSPSSGASTGDQPAALQTSTIPAKPEPRTGEALLSDTASADSRVSRQAVTSEAFPWLPVILLVLGLACFAAYTRRRRKRPQAAPPGKIEYVPLVPPTPADSRVMPEDQASFLEALEEGESAMESNVETIRPDSDAAIDIDSRIVSDDDEERG